MAPEGITEVFVKEGFMKTWKIGLPDSLLAALLVFLLPVHGENESSAERMVDDYQNWLDGRISETPQTSPPRFSDMVKRWISPGIHRHT